MSRQSSDMGQEETTKKGGRGKRRGPWEVWVVYSDKKSWRSNWYIGKEWMMRDYATKELAETAVAKFKREIWYQDDTIEVRYNERKA